MPSFYSVYCGYHAIVDCVVGILMLFNLQGLSNAAHGASITETLFHHDAKLLVASEKLVGVLLIAIGLFVLCMSQIPTEQARLRVIFGAAALAAQLGLLGWRVFIESHLEVMRSEWKNQAIGDLIHILGWILALYFASRVPNQKKQS
jgi:hypothetical protein